MKEAIEKTVATYGVIHAALPIAGAFLPVFTLTDNGPMDMVSYRKTIELNLFGVVHVVKYAAMAMSKNQPVGEFKEKGVIIFVSSVVAYEGGKSTMAYGASKAALNGMVLPMARDLGKYSIRVAAIAPGIMSSPMTDSLSEPERKALTKDTPMDRMGHPTEFAHMMGAMIENSYINGVTLRLDGAIKLSNDNGL